MITRNDLMSLFEYFDVLMPRNALVLCYFSEISDMAYANGVLYIPFSFWELVRAF